MALYFILLILSYLDWIDTETYCSFALLMDGAPAHTVTEPCSDFHIAEPNKIYIYIMLLSQLVNFKKHYNEENNCRTKCPFFVIVGKPFGGLISIFYCYYYNN